MTHSSFRVFYRHLCPFLGCHQQLLMFPGTARRCYGRSLRTTFVAVGELPAALAWVDLDEDALGDRVCPVSRRISRLPTSRRGTRLGRDGEVLRDDLPVMTKREAADAKMAVDYVSMVFNQEFPSIQLVVEGVPRQPTSLIRAVLSQLARGLLNNEAYRLCAYPSFDDFLLQDLPLGDSVARPRYCDSPVNIDGRKDGVAGLSRLHSISMIRRIKTNVRYSHSNRTNVLILHFIIPCAPQFARVDTVNEPLVLIWYSMTVNANELSSSPFPQSSSRPRL